MNIVEQTDLKLIHFVKLLFNLFLVVNKATTMTAQLIIRFLWT